MTAVSPTQILEEEPSAELEFERHEEIERLLRHLSALWDQEDFSDMPPRNLPT
jgi:hypothetical protein